LMGVLRLNHNHGARAQVARMTAMEITTDVPESKVNADAANRLF